MKSDYGLNRWFRFRLRGLLLLIAIISLGLGIKTKQVRNQQRAVDAVRKAGGVVKYSGPTWLRQLCGDAWFGTVSEIAFRDYTVADKDLRSLLNSCPDLIWLDLSDTKVEDDTLSMIGSIKGLKVLFLANTSISNTGLQHLKHLKKLRRLDLQGTHVTNAGMQHLYDLTSLRFLHLQGTDVTSMPEWMRARKSLEVTMKR